MFKIIKAKLDDRSSKKYDTLVEYAPGLAQQIAEFKFDFQQGAVDDMAASAGKRLPTEEMMDLSSVVCAGTCYWSGLRMLGLEERSLTEFIDEIYNPENKIKHTLGIDHIKLIKHVGSSLDGRFFGLALNPFRKQEYKAFKAYGGYFGKESLSIYKKSLLGIKSTSDAVKEILKSGGLAVVSIQATFNGYSPNFHDILILGYSKKEDGFLIFDPDARVYFDTQKQRPKNVSPLKNIHGLYRISSAYMDSHTYREKPSPGGITVGLFSKKLALEHLN